MMQNFFKAGNKYFFNLHGKVNLGTLQYCENCGRACHVNSVTVVKASYKLISKRYNSDMDNAEELSYNETQDACLCETCDK